MEIPNDIEFTLTLDEEDLSVFTKVYKELKSTFRSRTQMALIHLADDIWSFSIIGLTTREWITFCAFVYNELPEEETEGREVVQAPEGLSEETEEALRIDTPSLEEPDEDEEEPEAEPQRVIRKPVVVRKIGSNVTVEED